MLMLLLLISTSNLDETTDLAKERQRFVGTWELGAISRDGKNEKEPVGGKTRYIFSADGTYAGMVGDSKVGKGTFKPILKTNPAAIDWTTASRQEYDGKLSREYPSVGIYRFDNDKLTIVLKLQGQPADRPKDFENHAGAGYYTITLHRVKE